MPPSPSLLPRLNFYPPFLTLLPHPSQRGGGICGQSIIAPLLLMLFPCSRLRSSVGCRPSGEKSASVWILQGPQFLSGKPAPTQCPPQAAGESLLGCLEYLLPSFSHFGARSPVPHTFFPHCPAAWAWSAISLAMLLQPEGGWPV